MTLSRHVGVALAAIVSVVLVGCGAAEPATAPDDDASTASSVEFPASGDVVDVREWVSAPRGDDELDGKRILYRSTDIKGKPNIVSGTVFEPAGTPPQGGWPILALGHGSTGINRNCAPSLTGNLYGLAWLVQKYLLDGIAVAFADYSGLGSDSGPHPYLDPYAAARTMIDSVRAISQVYPEMSTKWLTYGVSQGAAASWAANEIAATYAPELRLVGGVAQVPTTSKAPMADLAASGRLSLEQQGILQWLEESLARRNSDMNLSDYRRGGLAEHWNALSTCSPARERALRFVSSPDFVPASPAATDRLRGMLAEMALPRSRLNAPLLVLYGGKDKFNDPAWTKTAIGKACEMGGPVTINYQPDAGHTGINTSSISPYLEDRLQGKSVRDDCRR